MPWLAIRVKVEIPKNRHGQAPCQLGYSPGAGTGMNPVVHGALAGPGVRTGEHSVLELQAGTLANNAEVHEIHTNCYVGRTAREQFSGPAVLRLLTHIALASSPALVPGADLARTSFPSRPPLDRGHLPAHMEKVQPLDSQEWLLCNPMLPLPTPSLY